MSVNLDTIAEPTDADLSATEDVSDLTASDWEALLEPVVVVTQNDEDYWAEDDNAHDDRYDGTGVPSWSAWA